MNHTRLWWVVLACLLTYWGTITFMTSGVLIEHTGAGGNPIATLVAWVLVCYFFLGPAITIVLFGAALFTDLMIWRALRQEWKARLREQGQS